MHVDLKKGETLELEPLDEFVGHGSTAAVDLIRCRGIKLARKTVLLRRNLAVKDILQEVYALHKLRHSHIIRLVGTYLRGSSFRILLYLVADHTLADLMVSLVLENDRYALRGIQQGQRTWKASFSQSSLCLISALRYIHYQGIKHMDIKPQNILVKFITAEAYKMYLCDFGVSHIFEAHHHSQTDSFLYRTPRYAAPEVASDESHGRAADIFSIGCMLAEMNSVFSDFSIMEFDTDRQGAMIIPSGTRRVSHETGSSVPYNQTVERAQDWVRSLCQMEVDPATIASMLEKDPAKRPMLHVGQEAMITLRCSHDADGPEPYDYDRPTALSVAAPASATGHPEAR